MRASDFKGHMGDVLRVEWHDAYSVDPWMPLEGMLIDPLPCTTVGFLIGVNAHNVAVASTLNANADVCGTMVIPLGMVQRFTVVDGKAMQNEAERYSGSGWSGGADAAGLPGKG